MKKKVLLMCMVVAMLFAFAMPTAAATYDDLTYEVENGEVTITDCSTYASGALEIPATIEGCPVTSIGLDAFMSCASLTSVMIPNSVTSIGDYAFMSCASLTSVTIPASVTDIGNRAFWGCDSLTSVTIPSSVTSIGVDPFSFCENLTSITVADENSNYSSSDGVLFDKDKTELIQYPIGNSRTSYVIPDSVTSIGAAAFWDCYNLTSITVADENSNYSSSDGVLFNKDKTELIQYPIGNSRTSYTIPNSVTNIGDSAFYGCTSLTSVTIPDSVTSIWSGALSGCSNLASITVVGENPKYSSSDGVLFNKDKTELIQYPIGNSRTSYVIPDSVTNIGFDAFINCDSLTSVTIPNSVTSIGESAFWYCDNLTLYGYSGSTAETHAKKYGIPFEILNSSVPVPGVPTFSDVKDSDWFASYVYDLAGRGILNGMTETTFAPDALLTRAQFAKILAAASGEDLTAYKEKTSFNDVATSAWFAPYVQWAYENKIVSGMGGGKFEPETNVSREQMAAMIKRYADYKGIAMPQNNAKLAFKDDASISGWAKDNVYAMQQAGIINGYADGNGFVFKPQGNAKRSEAAKMISVFLELK